MTIPSLVPTTGLDINDFGLPGHNPNNFIDFTSVKSCGPDTNLKLGLNITYMLRGVQGTTFTTIQFMDKSILFGVLNSLNGFKLTYAID